MRVASIPRVDNVSANRNDLKTPAVRRHWRKAGLVCKRLQLVSQQLLLTNDRQVLSDCSTPTRRVVKSAHPLFA
jgi:hypothetical protein